MVALRIQIILVIVIRLWIETAFQWQPFLQSLYNEQTCPNLDFIQQEPQKSRSTSQVMDSSPMALLDRQIAQPQKLVFAHTVVRIERDAAWWPYDRIAVSGSITNCPGSPIA